jgi:hypothetical protein
MNDLRTAAVRRTALAAIFAAAAVTAASADAVHLACEANSGSSSEKTDFAIDLDAHTVVYSGITNSIVDEWTNDRIKWHQTEPAKVTGDPEATEDLEYSFDRNTGTLTVHLTTVRARFGDFHPNVSSTESCRQARKVL